MFTKRLSSEGKLTFVGLQKRLLSTRPKLILTHWRAYRNAPEATAFDFDYTGRAAACGAIALGRLEEGPFLSYHETGAKIGTQLFARVRPLTADSVFETLLRTTFAEDILDLDPR